MSSAPTPACTPKTAFWLKRLHSITGLIPLGGFILEHLYSNSAIVRGPDAYGRVIDDLWRMPYIKAMEIGLIFVPIAFHMLMGLWMTWQGVWNYGGYREQRNLFFILQRVTGFYLTAFIIYHLYTTRFSGMHDPHGFFDLLKNNLSHPLVAIFYLGGMMAISFHFANGIWLGLVRWGVTVGPAAQSMAGKACAGFGVLFFLGWMNVIAGLFGCGIKLALGNP